MPNPRSTRGAERIGTVLVVEDDPDLAAVLVEGLRAHAVRVTWAADAPEARRLLGDDVDVLVTDFALGVEDGLALVRHVRATPALAHAAVVLVSGHPDPRRLECAVKALDAVFVPKPFELRALLAAIGRATALVPPTLRGAA